MYTRTPDDPNGLLLFISLTKCPSKKYLVRGIVLLRHYKALFIKQVFPKFERPTRPYFAFAEGA